MRRSRFLGGRIRRPSAGRLLSLLGLAVVLGVPVHGPAGSVSPAPRAPVGPITTPENGSSNATVTLSVTGIDPVAISFHGSVSGDSCGSAWWNLSDGYALTGPFETWSRVDGNNTSVNWPAEFLGGLGGADYWEASLYDPCTDQSLVSTPITVSLPSAPSLTYDLVNATTLVLQWTNPSTYGGLISFSSYAVAQWTANGGPFVDIANMTGIADLNYTVTLSLDTGYVFYIIFEDDYCTGCTEAGTYVLYGSNEIDLHTVSALGAQASASRSVVDAGEPVEFSCRSIGGSAVDTYTWAFGDGSSAEGANVSYAYGAVGTWNATCTSTDNQTQTAQSTVSISVDPALVVTSRASDTRAAPGFRVSFSSNVTGGTGTYVAFYWSFGRGAVASGRNATYAFGEPGLYNVTVSVVDTNGAVTTATIPVNVSALVVLGRASVTATRVGAVVTFNASATGGGGAPYTFTWEFGDGTSARGPVVTHAFSTAGTYRVTIGVSDALGSLNGSAVASVVVTGAASTNGLGERIFGVPVYLAAALGAALVATAILVLLVRRRRTRPPNSGTTTPAVERQT